MLSGAEVVEDLLHLGARPCRSSGMILGLFLDICCCFLIKDNIFRCLYVMNRKIERKRHPKGGAVR